MISVSKSNAGPPSVSFNISTDSQPPSKTKMETFSNTLNTNTKSSTTIHTVHSFNLKLLNHWIEYTANNPKLSKLLLLLRRITNNVNNIQSNSETLNLRKQVTSDMKHFVSNVIKRVRETIKESLSMLLVTLQNISVDTLRETLNIVHDNEWLAHCSCISPEHMYHSTKALEYEVICYVYKACFKHDEERKLLQREQKENILSKNKGCAIVSLLLNGLSLCVSEVVAKVNDSTFDGGTTIDMVHSLMNACVLWSYSAGYSNSINEMCLILRIVSQWRTMNKNTFFFDNSQRGQYFLSQYKYCLPTFHQTTRLSGCSYFAREISARGALRGVLGRPKASHYNGTCFNFNLDHSMMWLLDVVCALDKNIKQLNVSQSLMAMKNNPNEWSGQCGQERENPCMTMGGCLLYSGLYLWTATSNWLSKIVSKNFQYNQQTVEKNIQKYEILHLLQHNVRFWMLQCMQNIQKYVNGNSLVNDSKKMVQRSCCVFADASALLTLVRVNARQQEKNSLLSLLAKDLLILRSKLMLLILELIKRHWSTIEGNEVNRMNELNQIRKTLKLCPKDDVRVFLRSIGEI
jgi:hypothetical protein